MYIDENGEFLKNYDTYEDDNTIIRSLVYFEEPHNSTDETFIYILCSNYFSIIAIHSSTLKISASINAIAFKERLGISEFTLD